MIRIQQLKLPVGHTEAELEKKILRLLHIGPQDLESFQIVRKSLDSRRKEIYDCYTVDVAVKEEKQLSKTVDGKNIAYIKPVVYQFPAAKVRESEDQPVSDSRPTVPGIISLAYRRPLSCRPVVVGCGPAGLFCAYFLALHGYAPIILERGRRVEERKKDVELFWRTGILDPESNVQFGEGGAGTFSDGKLNTQVKDPYGRGTEVLKLFVQMGAPEDILFDARPHIGTDILVSVISALRAEIMRLGGDFRFETKLSGLELKDGELTSLVLADGGRLPAEAAVLALGHSARDTYAMLNKKGIRMEPKAFAAGFRIEHPQEMVNRLQYHGAAHPLLPPAVYKVQAKTSGGRGVYSFCMCPGGYVINASSEERALAVNGMSYRRRDAQNANSAIVFTVTPADFPSRHALAGVEFQRMLEKKAYALANGAIPQQLYGDFKENRISAGFGEFSTCAKGSVCFANLRGIFTEEMNRAFLEGMEYIGSRMNGFCREDAILSGVESRTSAPVRILRDGQFESNIKGLYPCGEGAGYAGGIMSAAMDGMKVAEAIATKYAPCATW